MSGGRRARTQSVVASERQARVSTGYLCSVEAKSRIYMCGSWVGGGGCGVCV